MRRALLILALCLLALSGHAAELTGTLLLSFCEDPGAERWCAGYVTGVWHLAGKQGLTCTPKGATAAEIKQIVIKYLQDNPKILQYDGDTLVVAALLDTFPCSGKK